MPRYPIEVIETYKYVVEIEAGNPKAALKEAKRIYESNETEGLFVADAATIDKTRFKVAK